MYIIHTNTFFDMLCFIFTYISEDAIISKLALITRIFPSLLTHLNTENKTLNLLT